VTTVYETFLATREASGLRGEARKAYEAFLIELEHAGCRALGYRVTGPEPLPRICVKHLRGRDRVVVTFLDEDSPLVLLVGQHCAADPDRDIYNLLYRLAGVEPPDEEKRTKPACCGDGNPPVLDEALIDDLVDRARELARSHR
jgi:hypothetical protein